MAIGHFDSSLVGIVDILAPQGRPAVGIAGIVGGGDIAQVTGQVHGFVIADHGDDLTVGAGRFFLQPHEILDDLERIRAAIDGVAGLD